MAEPVNPLSRFQQWMVIVLFLALIGIVCVGDNYRMLTDAEAVAKALAEPPNPRRPLRESKVMGGEFTGNFEHAIERVSPIMSRVRPRWYEAMFLMGTMPTPKVAVGPNGWLWYVDEFANPHQGMDMDYSVRRVEEVRDHLAQMGIPLLVVPIPLRAAFERNREELPSWVRFSEEYLTAYERFVAAMREKSIPCVDLVPGYEKIMAEQPEVQLFRPHDNHWSPEGALHAARITADYVNQQGLLDRADLRTAYTDSLTSVTTENRNMGPVGGMLGFRIKSSNRDRIVDVMKDVRWVPKPGSAVDTGSLSRVRIFGTSFTQHLSQVWPNNLSHALGCRVNVPVHPPQGVSIINTLERALAEEGRPDLVIWEFPDSFIGGAVFITVRRPMQPVHPWQGEVVQEFPPASAHVRMEGGEHARGADAESFVFNVGTTNGSFLWLRAERGDIHHGPDLGLEFEVRRTPEQPEAEWVGRVDLDAGVGFPLRVQEFAIRAGGEWQRCLIPIEDPLAASPVVRFLRLWPGVADAPEGGVEIRNVRLLRKSQ